MKLLDIHEPGQTPLPHQDSMAVGIDLGTTHSLVAVANDERVQVIKNTHGHGLVPSVVYYGPGGTTEVGYSAKARADKGEPGVVASAKRLMGRAAEEIGGLTAGRYELLQQGGMLRFKLPHATVTPVEVSAEILKHLKHDAERALGKTVDKAVITVPAYFDDAARTATKDAARLAGLEVLRLVNEPTAAALAYGLDKGAQGIYAVFDLGGGTFDISLLKLEQGVFQVLATAGDTQLGGDDFDHALVAWLLSELDIHPASATSGEIGELLALARETKHLLTNYEHATIPYRGKEVILSREDFNQLILPYVERALSVCEQALIDANLTVHDVQGVVMVGGSTRVPLVQARVAELFAKTPLTDVDPDEVVALGAALQAHGLTAGSDNLLLDVAPLSLGLETMGGLTEKLIYRNSAIPASVSQEFTTFKDGQSGMQFHIVQGEREMAADNRSLARFELSGIPALPAGIARVEVTFTVDADGLLTVSAAEKTTGARQTVNVRPSYGLSFEEMETMLRASMEHARTDITQRLLVESRVEAERAIVEIESALKSDGDLLTPAEIERLKRQMQTVKNAMESDDRDYIDAETHELARIAQPFAEKRMDRAMTTALKGTHVNQAI